MNNNEKELYKAAVVAGVTEEFGAMYSEVERLRTENTAWRNYVQSMSAGAMPVVAIAPTTGQATIVFVTPNRDMTK